MMNSDSSDQRTRFYNRIAKAGLIGSAVAFGSLVLLVTLPVDRTIGLIGFGAAFFLMIPSFIALVAAIAARDISTWKRNRWRFSLSSLFYVTYSVAVGLGSIVAAARGVSLSHILMAWGGFLIVSFIVTTAYINWARVRYFSAMNAQDRFRDWSAIADAIGRGEGTLLVGKLHLVPTVWWSERRISAPEEARTAIESDAMLTLCPPRKHIPKWLKATFPEVPVIDMD
jgi:hypothetical protein